MELLELPNEILVNILIWCSGYDFDLINALMTCKHILNLKDDVYAEAKSRWLNFYCKKIDDLCIKIFKDCLYNRNHLEDLFKLYIFQGQRSLTSEIIINTPKLHSSGFYINYCIVADDREYRIDHILEAIDVDTKKNVIFYVDINEAIYKFGEIPSKGIKTRFMDGQTYTHTPIVYYWLSNSRDIRIKYKIYAKPRADREDVLNMLEILSSHPENSDKKETLEYFKNNL